LSKEITRPTLSDTQGEKEKGRPVNFGDSEAQVNIGKTLPVKIFENQKTGKERGSKQGRKIRWG